MPHTLRRGGNAIEQAVEEIYGPPQHSAGTTAQEQTLYGSPQHETDVVVNADLREPLDYVRAWIEMRTTKRRKRPRMVSSPNIQQSYP